MGPIFAYLMKEEDEDKIILKLGRNKKNSLLGISKLVKKAEMVSPPTYDVLDDTFRPHEADVVFNCF